MSDVATLNPTQTTPADSQGTAGGSSGATSTPAQSVNGSAPASPANSTARPVDVAKEALNRLRQSGGGAEAAKRINAELYQGQKPGAAAEAGSPSAQAGGKAAAGSGESATAAAAAPTTSSPLPADLAKLPHSEQAAALGLTPDELNQLKRAKYPLDGLTLIPPSNRKALAGHVAKLTAERDRAEVAYRQSVGRLKTDPQAAIADPAADPNLEPDTQQTDQIETPEPAQSARTAKPGKNGAAAAAAPVAQDEAAPAQLYALDPQVLDTLKRAGGEEFADGLSKALLSPVHQLQRQNAQLRQESQQLREESRAVLQFILDDIENRHFESGVAELRKQPGYEQLTDADLSALRKNAEVLINARGNPKEFFWKQAIPLAAAGLTTVNTAQALQARQATQRTATLAATGARPSGKPASAARLSPVQRAQAIQQEMKRGASGEEARRRVDGL